MYSILVEIISVINDGETIKFITHVEEYEKIDRIFYKKTVGDFYNINPVMHGRSKMMNKWWLQKPMRMVQTNLREIDVNFDIDDYVASLRDFSTEVVLFNVGGIIANYPTKLQFHYRNPHLPGEYDFVGRVIESIKKEGIRFIARFDFSKVNESLAVENPEWLYKSPAGEYINYNGQVHTCINGRYQQEYAFGILEEVIERYPIDGVFFNMAGYVTYDYSGNYHGICQCQSCKKRFKDITGHNLPQKEDKGDPIFRLYDRFREDTCKEHFNRIARFIKEKNDDIAISTWGHEGIDIYRSESNTGIDRPLPEWNYSASQNVKTVLGSWEEIAPSNTAVHFIDFPYRHSAVSPNLTMTRLAQNIANGGWADYYVIGTLMNQDDRTCFEGVKELFRFHKTCEKFFTGIKSVADICLIAPYSSQIHGSMKEFKGIYRILSESHTLFDIMHDTKFDSPDILERLKQYQLIILPDLRNMADETARIIDRYVKEGGKLLSTGFISMYSKNGDFLEEIGLDCTGVERIEKVIGQQRGSYLRVRPEDKNILKGFSDLDIVYLDGDFIECHILKEACGILGYMPPCMFGPPEKCYYTVETDIPGVISNQYGRGLSAFIPWTIGRHYDKLSNHAHYKVIAAAINDVLKLERSMETDAAPLLEITSHMEKTMKWQIVNFVNISGQLGTGFHVPVQMRQVHIKVKVPKLPRELVLLKSHEKVTFDYSESGYLELVIPYIDLLEVLLIKF